MSALPHIIPIPTTTTKPAQDTAGADVADAAAAEEHRFADALKAYMKCWHKTDAKAEPTPGEVADVLLSLGYVPPGQARDFRLVVKRMAAALAKQRQARRRTLLTRGEMLAAALADGWTRP